MDRRFFLKSSGATLAGATATVLPLAAIAADDIVVGSISKARPTISSTGAPGAGSGVAVSGSVGISSRSKSASTAS